MKTQLLNWDLSNVDGVIILVNNELKGYEEFAPAYAHFTGKKVFEAKDGSIAHITSKIGESFKEVVFVGSTGEYSEKLVEGLAKAYKKLRELKVKNIGVDVSVVTEGIKKLSRSLGEVFTMAEYKFDIFKSDKEETSVENVLIGESNLCRDHFEEGLVLGECNVTARKLTNDPANKLTPTTLANFAQSRLQPLGVEVEVKGLEEIKELGMTAFLAVAQGSAQEPKLIVMRYNGRPDSDQRLVFVGKGLTYDSGGYSIKPTNSMLTMKDDMSGASAVIGAMEGIARLGVKTNVTCVVAACENLISGTAYKPGDIIMSMAGKSIFIGNTDAEGRLTLVDAVTYAIEKEKATHVLDICTLTGAAIVATGTTVAPVLSNNDDFYKITEKSFAKSAEKIWRLPLFEEYKELLKHPEADLNNSAGNPGTITAAMFIEAFVGETPWVHVDIAGTAWSEKDSAYISRGGTGSGVRPLIHLAKKFSK